MSNVIATVFDGGDQGAFEVLSMQSIVGKGLAPVARVRVLEGTREPPAPAGTWTLLGATGNLRYVERSEQQTLAAVTPPLGRPEASLAALIPIRKNPEWWALPQDERRAILAERSRHIEVGLAYLPAVARRLYHSRELGEPFDFLTWFEFSPTDAGRFDELLGALRASEEWAYVDREVEIRLARDV